MCLTPHPSAPGWRCCERSIRDGITACRINIPLTESGELNLPLNPPRIRCTVGPPSPPWSLGILPTRSHTHLQRLRKQGMQQSVVVVGLLLGVGQNLVCVLDLQKLLCAFLVLVEWADVGVVHSCHLPVCHLNIGDTSAHVVHAQHTIQSGGAHGGWCWLCDCTAPAIQTHMVMVWRIIPGPVGLPAPMICLVQLIHTTKAHQIFVREDWAGRWARHRSTQRCWKWQSWSCAYKFHTWFLNLALQNPTTILSECCSLRRDRDWNGQSGDHTRRQIQLETPSLSLTENLRDCIESEIWLVATFMLNVNVSLQIPYLNFESFSPRPKFFLSECCSLRRDRDWNGQSGHHTHRRIQLETPPLSVTENLRDCTESEVWQLVGLQCEPTNTIRDLKHALQNLQQSY